MYACVYLGQTALHVAVESHGKYEDVDCRDAILRLFGHGLKLKDQVYDLRHALFQRIFGKQLNKTVSLHFVVNFRCSVSKKQVYVK